MSVASSSATLESAAFSASRSARSPRAAATTAVVAWAKRSKPLNTVSKEMALTTSSAAAGSRRHHPRAWNATVAAGILASSATATITKTPATAMPVTAR